MSQTHLDILNSVKNGLMSTNVNSYNMFLRYHVTKITGTGIFIIKQINYLTDINYSRPLIYMWMFFFNYKYLNNKKNKNFDDKVFTTKFLKKRSKNFMVCYHW